MKRLLGVMAMVLLCCGGQLSSAQAQRKPNKGVEGIWQGTLEVAGGINLRVVFKIKSAEGGKYTATLDSIDQNAKDIPIDTVTFAEGKLHLGVKVIAGGFDGTLNSAGTAIVGKWTQPDGELPLTLARTAKALELRRPQEPKAPFPYKAEDVSYPNPKAGTNTLAGTLTLPQGSGPFPVVLMITGSGPQNRDEELLGHKPFWIIADYLTRQGIAVLRVDDRGVGKSTGNFATATSADFATDVMAGIAYLKTRKEINPKQIGLAGHSEGGLIAPMVAAQSPDVAFIVMLAGPGVNGEEILYEQGRLITKAAGASEQAVAQERKTQQEMFTIVKAAKDSAEAEKNLDAYWTKKKTQLTPEEKKQVESAGEAAMKAQLKSVASPWFRYFLTYDPHTALQKVTCPVLALNGSNDLQVPPKQSLPEIEKALKAGGNTDFTLKELPKLNHLFQTSTTGSPSEYNVIEETFAPEALKIMGDWIKAHTKSSGSP